MTDPLRSDQVPPAALWLGGAGVLPFAGLALLASFGPAGWQGAAVTWLEGYGVAILSFMGGCRWGFAAAGLGRGPDWGPIAGSVVPALYAWAVAGALAPPWSLALLALGFVALLGADVALTRAGGAPAWWPRLRWPLTAGAAVSLLLGAGA
ncbi:MAG: DUF3429 domain-containing protein [Paracoccaceae bacterium]